MIRMNRFCSLFLLTIALFWANPGSAQVFQKLHAYHLNNQTVTGEYMDVAWIGGNATTALVGVGTSSGALPQGLVSINDPWGNPKMFFEFSDGSNAVEGVAIDNAPNGDFVSVFFNSGANASEVIRMDGLGNVLWGKRLPGIRVLDLEVAACSYAGGDGIWVSGYSTSNNKFSVQGLDANGAQVFAREYSLSNPVFSISNSEGTEIKYDKTTDELVIVGHGQIINTPSQAMFFSRLNLAGNWITGTATFDPLYASAYRGESLFKDPQMGKYVVGFDYVSGGARSFAACEMDYSGYFNWINQYTTSGVFATNFAKVSGIRHFGPSVLMSGFYIHSSGFPRAMSMAIDPVGNPITVSAYPTNGNFPIESSLFRGMDVNPYTGHEYMVGNFRTPATGGTWPQGSNPSSFFLISTDEIGQSACHDFGFQGAQALDPKVVQNIETHIQLPNVTNTPMTILDVEPLSTDECNSNKQGLVDELFSEVEISHHADGSVVLDLPLEEKGGFEIQLLNLQGKILSTSNAQKGPVELQTQGLAAGIYLIRFQSNHHHGVRKLRVGE